MRLAEIKIAIVGVAVVGCGNNDDETCMDVQAPYSTDICIAMIKGNAIAMLTICDNVHHPELQHDWFAHCTRVLCPH